MAIERMAWLIGELVLEVLEEGWDTAWVVWEVWEEVEGGNR